MLWPQKFNFCLLKIPYTFSHFGVDRASPHPAVLKLYSYRCIQVTLLEVFKGTYAMLGTKSYARQAIYKLISLQNLFPLLLLYHWSFYLYVLKWLQLLYWRTWMLPFLFVVSVTGCHTIGGDAFILSWAVHLRCTYQLYLHILSLLW